MKSVKKAISLCLMLTLLLSVLIVSSNSYNDNITANAATSTSGITVHYKNENKTGTPTIYYWNSLPVNIDEPTYPGVKMTADSNGWYTYTFNTVTKINMLFINSDGSTTSELTRGSSGEYWYKVSESGKGRWYSSNPEELDDYERTDLREETIYFVITTRFYDGDTGNNVHCWDDSTANNPDSDPAWRGDFKGLIDKLDYIKALGFSAIWITPVVTNASGYDYHGYHALDFTTVDVRYESDGATYQDLIDAAHEKDMKIIQDVVWNHTGNFGEANLCPLFEKKYDTIQDLADIESCMVPTAESGFGTAEEYYSLLPYLQYQKRLDAMKQLDAATQNGTESPLEDVGNTDKVSTSSTANPNNYYHNGYWQSLNWDDWTCKYSQIAGDCVDLNTENPAVAEYLLDAYTQYINMGVDAFRVDTVRHISRLSLNMLFNQQFNAAGGENFYMFGEVCCRYSNTWYREHASESVQFYTWAEPDKSYSSKWSDGTDADSVNANMDLTLQHWLEYDDITNQPTSDNAFLDGNNYHTPDYSQSSGMGVIDFTMHWQFGSAQSAFTSARSGDKYYNDSTWNVVYVESHDYAPDTCQQTRFTGGTAAWAENLSLMFTFRGIPCLYYGGEVEFQAGCLIDKGTEIPLSTSGRAYFGDYLEGTVTATDFGEYTASGTVADTLNSTLSQHIIKLNQIRRAIPALQKGQYSVEGINGNIAFKRGYTDPETGEKSFVCVTVTSGATFTGIPNGTYIDAVTGDTKAVTNGILTISAPGQSNCRVYVLSSNGYTGIDGKIGGTTTYLK